MLDVFVGQASDAGRLRANNEDAAGWVEVQTAQAAGARGWMFVVADGAGGLDFGDVAAAKTVATLVEGFAAAEVGKPAAEEVAELIAQANEAVHAEAAAQERRGQRMASTVAACAVRDGRATVAHLGDSRCYLLRAGKIVAATEDHTLVNEQRRLGLMTSVAAESAENRKVLTRSVGLEPEVRVELAEWRIEAGDQLLLCTDGVHGGVYDQDIVRILEGTQDAQAAAEELVRYAIQVDGSDNATAVVVRVVEQL